MKYNREKMLSSVLFILHELGGRTDWHSLHKILYIADKKSLVDRGKMISDNTYVRMPWGPVPSELDYLLEALRCDGAQTTYFGRPVSSILKTEGNNHVIALEAPDTRFLSRFNIECLQYGLEVCKGLDFGERTRITHDFAWDQAQKNGVALVKQNIAIAGGAQQDCLDYIAEMEEAEACL